MRNIKMIIICLLANLAFQNDVSALNKENKNLDINVKGGYSRNLSFKNTHNPIK